MFDDLLILLRNLSPLFLNGDNQVNNEAGSLNDVAKCFMDLIDAKDNEDT